MTETSSTDSPGDVTLLLRDAARGSEDAARELMPLVYGQLRALAASYLHGERRAHTLQPTALVNEAFVRLLQGAPVHVETRAHFFALAARVMRNILVDSARERAAAKRGDGLVQVTLDEHVGAAPGIAGMEADILDVHDALEQLGALHQRQARVVELRYFGGLTISEIALLLGVSKVTVDNDWAAARAWLFKKLRTA